MSIIDTGILRLMSRKMEYDGQRLSVLSQNVANADTPGYKAQDLEPFTFEAAMRTANGAMAVTDPKHILPAKLGTKETRSRRAATYETVPSGNSVDLEQQMMNVSQTSLNYQTEVSIYQKFVGFVRTALK
jgi:flagellar basal-body rod protein FlgB